MKEKRNIKAKTRTRKIKKNIYKNNDICKMKKKRNN